MKVKVKDIAELAGVSSATVSLVLNQKPCRIAEETKERIFRVAKELQYQQDHFGIFQGFKKVKCIGAIVPELENPFFSEMAQCLSREFWRYGYTVFQCNIDQSFETFQNAVECLIGKNVDGVILIPPESIDKSGIKLVKSLQESSIPLVLLDRAVYSVFCDFVTSDNKFGGRSVVEHLLSAGYQRIGMIMGGENTYTSQKRLEGFKEAFAKHGMPFFEELVYRGRYSEESGYLGAELLLEKGVDAIFASNDQIALGVYRFAAEKNIKIGSELGVVGYDDSGVAGGLQPALTSVSQNITAIAEKAVELLMNRIERAEKEIRNSNFYFPPSLEVRASSDRTCASE